MFGSSSSATCDKPKDPCDVQDDVCPTPQGSFSGSSGASTKDQCVDPCAETVCDLQTNCVETDYSKSRQRQQMQNQGQSSSSQQSPQSSTPQVGSQVTVRSGRMINGKFVPNRLAGFQTTSSSKQAVGSQIGSKLDAFDNSNIRPANGLKMEANYSAASPYGVDQRLRIKAAMQARSGKTAKVGESVVPTFEERLAARRKARAEALTSSSLGAQPTEEVADLVAEIDRGMQLNEETHPLSERQNAIGCNSCGKNKSVETTGHKKDDGYTTDSTTDSDTDDEGEISF